MQTATKVMGILNITPDSFSDGGLYLSVDQALQHAQQMIDEGADIIDIGGESTRPGAQTVSAEEELARVVPVIQAIRQKINSDIPISVDTYKSQVAAAALEAGTNMINSLGGSKFDSQMYTVAQKHNAQVIIYHIKGEPRTMQQGEILYDDVMKEIMQFFEEEIAKGVTAGLSREKFILDPGIGFGKTVAQNLEIIRRFAEFTSLKLPVLIGVSRKSHLGALLKEKLHLAEVPSAHERLEAALAETVVAVLHGACIVRTHDVFATKKCLAVVDELRASA